jgi:hypothetical protein
MIHINISIHDTNVVYQDEGPSMGMNIQREKPTPPWHLILPLVYPDLGARVCPTLYFLLLSYI